MNAAAIFREADKQIAAREKTAGRGQSTDLACAVAKASAHAYEIEAAIARVRGYLGHQFGEATARAAVAGIVCGIASDLTVTQP